MDTLAAMSPGVMSSWYLTCPGTISSLCAGFRRSGLPVWSPPQAVRGPKGNQLGSTDPVLIDAWKAVHDCVSRSGHEGAKPSCLVRAVYYEPNQLKIEMDKMLLEHQDSIRVMYHSWGCKPILEDGAVKGVIFESKEGRKVVMAKVVVDATGDGDLFSQTGAPYKSLADGETRSSTTALVWRLAGCRLGGI